MEKAQGDPFLLQKAAEEHSKNMSLLREIRSNPLFLQQDNFLDSPFVARAEAEPNNFFDEADNIDDILAEPGVLAPDYNGRLVTGEFDTPEDIDVYAFTVDTSMMYYFSALHGTTSEGEEMDVNMRLFHESDLDTTFVGDFQGITGNDQIAGDILGRDTDGRGGAGLFRLTGWSSPVDPDTGEKLTGTFYLWVFNEDGNLGHYNMTAYAVPFDDWVDRKEPDYPYSALLSNAADPDYTLNTDAVPRTYMMHNPDTVKTVIPEIPSQSNSVYPLLQAEGDEDIDLYFIDYKQDHTLVLETLPYFGWYRTNEGDIGPGSGRMTDTRNRLYDGDFSQIIEEDDDGGRERHDGPNNIHSRMVITPEMLDERGLNEDGPLVYWVGAWASNERTRTAPDPGTRNVDNRDPGRGMYKVYAYQYNNARSEMEPNNTLAEATTLNAETQILSLQGASISSSDTDVFRVFLHELRMYSLFSTNSDLTQDLDIKIYHESASGPENTISVSGDLIAQNDIPVGRSGNDFTISGFVPEQTGAYLIEVTSGGQGTYDLGVLDKGEIFEGRISNEPDNTFAEATTQPALPVGPGAAARTAMIFPAADVDHYYFTTGDEFNITVKGTSTELVDDFDARITLLDDGLNEITSSTNGILSFTPEESSTFIVRVEAENEGDVGFYTVSGGEPFEESEPNDTFANATPAAIGELYEAAIDSPEDTDFFSFELKAGSLYSFRSVDNETGGALDVEFFDTENGETIMDDSGWVDNYSGDNFKIANIIPQETKTYYLKVSGGVGSYKVLSKENPDFAALAEKHEPDNSFEEARQQGFALLDGVDRAYAQFAPDSTRFFGDLDHFRLNLTAGQNFVAETKPIGGISTSSGNPDLWNRDTDTKLYLFDAEGNELASDDDGGNGWYSQLSFMPETDGEYFLQVANSRGEGGGDDRSLRRGDYILNMAASYTETEPNDSFADASNNPLGDRSFVEAAFSEDSDTDIFSVTLEQGRIYHLRSTKESDDLVMEVELYKADNTSANLLADGGGFATRYGSNNFKINFIPEESGEYFLKLTPATPVQDTPYRVYMKSNALEDLAEEWEGNDTIAEAAALGDHPADGVFYDYMLYDPNVEGFHDDLDYYQVTAAAGDTISAETAPFDGDLWTRDFDAYMYLYDADGNELATNDDGGQDWHSKITYEVSEDGAYYFLVIGQDAAVPPRNQDENRITDPARGEYKLAIARNPGETGTSSEQNELAYEFELRQNYPNPFNPTTTIQYSIGSTADVNLEVYNVIGQRVAVLVNQQQTPGQYRVNFDASSLASGLYLYRLESAGKVQTQKMMLIK